MIISDKQCNSIRDNKIDSMQSVQIKDEYISESKKQEWWNTLMIFFLSYLQMQYNQLIAHQIKKLIHTHYDYDTWMNDTELLYKISRKLSKIMKWRLNARSKVEEEFICDCNSYSLVTSI